jgi:hexulose-6-phosphate isomerase
MTPSLTRRSFLAAAGASAAGVAVAPPAAGGGVPARSARAVARDCRAERDCKKAVKLGMVRAGETVQQKFTLLKDLGFDGVELDSPSDLDRDEVVRARDATGLRIHGVVDSAHWRDTLSHADAAVRQKGVAALETALRDAKRYGASTVLLVPAVVDKAVSYAVAWERSQAEIRKVLPLADELGVRIALENVWNNFLLSPLETARYIDELDPKWVGAYFDVGNVVNYGWPEHWIEVLAHRILKVDVKEFSRQKRNDEGLWKGFNVELLTGDCDWPAVMKALDAVGYRGWFTAEIPGGDAERLAAIARDMDRIFTS